VRRATGIVLAGGKSSRMGAPKALLRFDGQPLIVHIVSAMQRLFDEIIVVAAPGQDLPAMPVTLVRDEVAHQGPVGGICYGLAAMRGEVAFVTSCDSAFLNTDLIAYQIEQVSDHDVVVPHWQGRLQPLHAVYRQSVLPLLQGQLERRELRPVILFDRVRTRRIEEDEIRRFDPEGLSFFNMNTPEDYAEALERWGEAATGARAEPRGPIECTVELFGVARLIGKERDVPLALPAGATLSDALSALAGKLPALVGRVIAPGGRHLVDGYACNVNGLEFVRHSASLVKGGDRIIIMSADAGG
jgi:molybdopterin-guanine dinucleotide biosynthesis protein A/molybdopterin converting factor small subunit